MTPEEIRAATGPYDIGWLTRTMGVLLNSPGMVEVICREHAKGMHDDASHVGCPHCSYEEEEESRGDVE